ncbi:unnamed protein product [Haemonchus placei]|uniref:Ragulator complex protein LAMTOR1 n=1 Tax=Haemonchus placei TaxID=6290 RepID=A0A0N4VVU1_HAEPC|nr:unnamed protein product [Haemonchus placei]
MTASHAEGSNVRVCKCNQSETPKCITAEFHAVATTNVGGGGDGILFPVCRNGQQNPAASLQTTGEQPSKVCDTDIFRSLLEQKKMNAASPTPHDCHLPIKVYQSADGEIRGLVNYHEKAQRAKNLFSFTSSILTAVDQFTDALLKDGCQHVSSLE